MGDASTETRAKRTVAVWGHYHGGNLGDEMVVSTIVAAIRRLEPTATIVGVSMSPADTRRRHGIPTFPIAAGPPIPATGGARQASPRAADGPRHGALGGALRRIPGARTGRILLRRAASVAREPRYVARALRFLHSVDTIVVAGSGQLLDEWEGPWRHPYTTFRWSVLARLTRTPMLFASVGAGPIDEPLSRVFIRGAVNSAAYVSVRDEQSGAVLRSIGCSGPMPVVPDIAWALPEHLLPRARPEPSGPLLVGVNVMAHQDPRYWPRGDLRRYRVYVERMTELIGRLLEDGHHVRLFSSQTKADVLVAAEVEARLRPTRPLALENALAEIRGADDVIRAVAGCHVVVAARYHSVLVPLLLGIPTLAQGYNPKTFALLADVGRPDWCLDIDTADVEALWERFARVAAETETAPDVRRRVGMHRSAVEAQFERILKGST